jgi:hypothetical protein
MTPASPTGGDIETFLKVDGWRQLAPRERGGSRQSHVFFEKLLDDGRLLHTHISHDRKATPSPGRLGAILSDQLEVSKEAFWQSIRTGQTAERPSAVDEAEAVELPSWVVRVLTGQMHMSADEIARLTAADAEHAVREFWAQRQG